MRIFLGLLFFMGALSTYAAGNIQSGLNKSSMCAACHGEKGVSTNDMWPNLAGQHAPYILKQLHDLKVSQSRHSEIMAPFVSGLSEQDMADLAVFYATQSRAVDKAEKHDHARGEQLYRSGDVGKQITACIACHGPKGLGNKEAGFPSLAGQKKTYTVQQLQAFKDHSRQNDQYGIMQMISAKMTKKEMMAVAEYLASLKGLD